MRFELTFRPWFSHSKKIALPRFLEKNVNTSEFAIRESFFLPSKFHVRMCVARILFLQFSKKSVANDFSTHPKSKELILLALLACVRFFFSLRFIYSIKLSLDFPFWRGFKRSHATRHYEIPQLSVWRRHIFLYTLYLIHTLRIRRSGFQHYRLELLVQCKRPRTALLLHRKASLDFETETKHRWIRFTP